MRIDITRRAGAPRLIPADEIRTVVRAALRAAGAPRASSVGIVLADDVELAGLNERHMGHAGPTDVLSFPLLPPGAFPAHPGQAAAVRHVSDLEAAFRIPPGLAPHLGDIVVSVERAMTQASAGRGGQAGDRVWAPADELRLLLVHGCLHLCGWDHADPVEGDAMRALEREVLGVD